MAVTIAAPVVSIESRRLLSWEPVSDSADVEAFAYKVYANDAAGAMSGGVEADVLAEDVDGDGIFRVDLALYTDLRGIMYIAVTALTMDGEAEVESDPTDDFVVRFPGPSTIARGTEVAVTPTHALTIRKRLG